MSGFDGTYIDIDRLSLSEIADFSLETGIRTLMALSERNNFMASKLFASAQSIHQGFGHRFSGLVPDQASKKLPDMTLRTREWTIEIMKFSVLRLTSRESSDHDATKLTNATIQFLLDNYAVLTEPPLGQPESGERPYNERASLTLVTSLLKKLGVPVPAGAPQTGTPKKEPVLA